MNRAKLFLTRFLLSALLTTGLMVVYYQAKPATQVLFASQGVEKGLVCPQGNVKYEIPEGFEYNDGTGWIDATTFYAEWGPNPDNEIGSVCIKIGGPGGGTLVWPEASAGEWTNPTKYEISHIVLYKGEPTPTPSPSVTPSVTPTDKPTATPSVSPTVSPTPTDKPTATPSVSLTPTDVPTVSPTATPSLSPTPTTDPDVTATPSPTTAPDATATPSPTTAPEVLGDEDYPKGEGEEVLGTTTLPATGSAHIIYFMIGLFTTLVAGYGLIKTGKQEIY